MKFIFLVIVIISCSVSSYGQFSVINYLENQSVDSCIYDSINNKIKFYPYVDDLNTCGVWFNFGVSGYRTDTVLSFEGVFSNNVYSTLAPAVSCNNRDFYHKDINYNYHKLILKLENPCDTTFISTGFPYLYSRLLNFIDINRQNKKIRIDTLDFSDFHRYIPLITITNHRKNYKKKLVWIICRQHAFESISNYVMEGVMQYLLSEECPKKLTNKYIFKIVPMVDVDNVCGGQTGRMSLPIDYNRAWDGDARSTINSLRQSIIKSAEKDNYYVFFDIHATYPGGAYKRKNFSYFDIHTSNVVKSQNLKKYWQNFYQLSGFKPFEIPDSEINYVGLPADIWNEKQFTNSLKFSTTVEIDWFYNNKNVLYQISDYLEIGKLMIQSLYKTRF